MGGFWRLSRELAPSQADWFELASLRAFEQQPVAGCRATTSHLVWLVLPLISRRREPRFFYSSRILSSSVSSYNLNHTSSNVDAVRPIVAYRFFLLLPFLVASNVPMWRTFDKSFLQSRNKIFRLTVWKWNTQSRTEWRRGSFRFKCRSVHGSSSLRTNRCFGMANGWQARDSWSAAGCRCFSATGEPCEATTMRVSILIPLFINFTLHGSDFAFEIGTYFSKLDRERMVAKFLHRNFWSRI